MKSTSMSTKPGRLALEGIALLALFCVIGLLLDLTQNHSPILTVIFLGSGAIMFGLWARTVRRRLRP
jgi:hypothetical protein